MPFSAASSAVRFRLRCNAQAGTFSPASSNLHERDRRSLWSRMLGSVLDFGPLVERKRESKLASTTLAWGGPAGPGNCANEAPAH